MALAAALALPVALIPDPDDVTYAPDANRDWLLGLAEPWKPQGAPTHRISGRVVTAASAPMSETQVQLVYEGDPHFPEQVAYETVTDAEGRFAFDGVWLGGGFLIVVRGAGGRRSFEVPRASEADELSVGDLPLAPDYPVHIIVRCGAAPRLTPPEFIERGPRRPLPARRQAPTVQLHVAPDGERYAQLVLGTVGAPAHESDVIPHRQTRHPRVPAGARTFGHTTRLPAGRYLATVSGSCGVVQREIDIAANSAGHRAVVLDAPAQEWGSIQIANESAEEAWVEVSRGAARIAVRRAAGGGAVHMDRLEPGRYALAAPDLRCRREVEIAAGGEAQLEFGSGDCRVSSSTQ